MKKKLTLLLIAPLLLSCSDDDNVQEPTVCPTQEYTSFEIFHNESVNLKNAVVGYYTKDGLCIKIGDLGDLTQSVKSKEIVVENDTLRHIYIFSDYPMRSSKLDTVLILKPNIKNTFELDRYTKGIEVNYDDEKQYPH